MSSVIFRHFYNSLLRGESAKGARLFASMGAVIASPAYQAEKVRKIRKDNS